MGKFWEAKQIISLCLVRDFFNVIDVVSICQYFFAKRKKDLWAFAD